MFSFDWFTSRRKLDKAHVDDSVESFRFSSKEHTINIHVSFTALLSFTQLTKITCNFFNYQSCTALVSSRKIYEFLSSPSSVMLISLTKFYITVSATLCNRSCRDVIGWARNMEISKLTYSTVLHMNRETISQEFHGIIFNHLMWPLTWYQGATWELWHIFPNYYCNYRITPEA